MFKIDNETKEIMITRGDIGNIDVSAKGENGTSYQFKVGDVVRLGVYKKKDYNDLKLKKEIIVEEETEQVSIPLTSQDTRIDNIINKNSEYWYEIQLNPDTNPQTIIGHDEKGAKIFRVYPEGVEE